MYLLIDGMQMLRGSKSFGVAEYQGMVGWFREYLVWMQTSPRGAIQSQALNHQGTWYDVQLASVLLFLGIFLFLVEI